MNNDAVVTNGWLDQLIAVLAEMPLKEDLTTEHPARPSRNRMTARVNNQRRRFQRTPSTSESVRHQEG